MGSSLESRTLPEGTAEGLLAAICKGGVKNNPENYRPVALTIWRKYLREY